MLQVPNGKNFFITGPSFFPQGARLMGPVIPFPIVEEEGGTIFVPLFGFAGPQEQLLPGFIPIPPPPPPPTPIPDVAETYIFLGPTTSFTLGDGTFIGERIGVADNLGLALATPKTISGNITGGPIVLNMNFAAIEFVWNGTQWSPF